MKLIETKNVYHDADLTDLGPKLRETTLAGITITSFLRGTMVQADVCFVANTDKLQSVTHAVLGTGKITLGLDDKSALLVYLAGGSFGGMISERKRGTTHLYSGVTLSVVGSSISYESMLRIEMEEAL